MRGTEPEPEPELEVGREMGGRTVGNECRMIRVLRGDELSVYIISFHFNWVWGGGVDKGREGKKGQKKKISEVGRNVDMGKKKRERDTLRRTP